MRKKKEVIILKPMMLLPPRKDKCQTCAVDHKPDQPHDATSLYYLTKFKMENNREGTWADAMSHCTPEMKQAWTGHLNNMGIDINSYKVRGDRPRMGAK